MENYQTSIVKSCSKYWVIGQSDFILLGFQFYLSGSLRNLLQQACGSIVGLEPPCRHNVAAKALSWWWYLSAAASAGSQNFRQHMIRAIYLRGRVSENGLSTLYAANCCDVLVVCYDLPRTGLIRQAPRTKALGPSLGGTVLHYSWSFQSDGLFELVFFDPLEMWHEILVPKFQWNSKH